MSRKLIVAVFQDQNSAYSVIESVKKADNSNFELYTGQMLSKDDKGNINIVESQDRGLIGTGSGIAIGFLLGAFGGLPVALAGAMIGSMTGLTIDVLDSAIDEDFVMDTVKSLNPGQTMVVLEANEGSTEFIDDLVAKNSGTINRSLIGYE